MRQTKQTQNVQFVLLAFLLKTEVSRSLQSYSFLDTSTFVRNKVEINYELSITLSITLRYSTDDTCTSICAEIK